LSLSGLSVIALMISHLALTGEHSKVVGKFCRQMVSFQYFGVGQLHLNTQSTFESIQKLPKEVNLPMARKAKLT